MTNLPNLTPTSCLPPLKSEPSYERLKAGLLLADRLYGKRKWNSEGARSDAEDGSDELEHEESKVLDALRADETERRYTNSWCMKILSLDLAWLENDEKISEIQELASRVIATEAALEEAGELERVFTFPLQKTNQTGLNHVFEIKLRDAPLPASTASDNTEAQPSENGAGEDHISKRNQSAASAVGVQTWGSAPVLCDLLSRDWSLLHPLLRSSDEETRNATKSPSLGRFRILELGAGTGLVGMLCAKLAHLALGKAAIMTATLTDYHQLVLENLRHNVNLNATDLPDDIHCKALDWSEVNAYQRQSSNSASLSAWWTEESVKHGYDVIVAADVIYSPEHPRWLLSCFEHFLSFNPKSRAQLLCPIRKTGRFGAWNLIATADQVFQEGTQVTTGSTGLHLLERREIPKTKGIGREDESGYVYWIFGRPAIQ